MSANIDEKEITKEEYMVEYIKTLAAIEAAIEPFKDQRRDLRENYHENDWLSKEEMRLAVRAYRLLKQDADFEQLTDYFNKLKGSVGVN
jgi:hypothetical protein